MAGLGSQLQNIGTAMQGFAAGLGGQLPQFQQMQNQRIGLQQQAQQQQIQNMEKMQAMAAERQKTMFTDANAALKLLDSGNIDGVLQLGINRLQGLKQLSQMDPNIDPSDTQRLVQLTIATKNGSEEAKELLKGELTSTVEIGKAIGVIPTPKAAEGATDLGKLKQDLNSGLITQEQYDAAAKTKDAERKTAEDVNGILRYIDTGEEVFPNVKKSESDPKTFQETGDLRKEFSSLGVVKSFAEQANAYGRVKTSAQDPSAAGDMSLIFGYMKLLDPASTVREGEQAQAQQATNIPGRVLNAYNAALKGEKLNDDQRADFVDRAERLYKDAESQFSKTYDQYSRIAEKRNLPVDEALVDYRYYGRNESKPETATGLPVVTTKAQFDALPSGAEYMEEDGKKYRKP